MYEEITLEFIQKNKFINYNSEIYTEMEKMSYRFSDNDVIPMSTEDKIIELRKKIASIIATKFENYSNMETLCAIHKDNVIKFISKGSRQRGNISRNVLGKLCVGARLSLEEAQELFILQGFALDPINNMFDAIVVSCLKKQDNIYEMIDMCQQYNVVIDKSSI